MSQADNMQLDERVFRMHLEGGPFQSGVDRGRWRLVSVDWPHANIGITAAGRTNGPCEYVLRFELTNYPQVPPTAQPWDVMREQALDGQRWPGGRGRIPLAFNPGWNGGHGLYLPCDREAIKGHDVWVSLHPDII